MENNNLQNIEERKNIELSLNLFETELLNDVDSKEKKDFEFIKNKFKKSSVNFAVIGQFKRGKSSFVNALIGDDILPTSVIPLTSVFTIVKYSEVFKAEVFFVNGSVRTISAGELSSYIAESENPANTKQVNYIEIGYPSDFLKYGMNFIDTPGVGSVHLNNTDSTYSFIPKIDAAIFITSPDPAFSDMEMDLLEEVLSVTDKIFFVMNKTDLVDNDELTKVSDYMEKFLRNKFKTIDFVLYKLSSRDALHAKNSMNNDLLRKSGFIDFENDIIRYFKNEKENILYDSVKRQFLNLVNEIEIQINLESKSMLLPVQELNEKQRTLFDDLNYFLEEKNSIVYKVRDDIKKLLFEYQNRLDEIISGVNNEIKSEIGKFESKNKFEKKIKYKKSLNELFVNLIESKIEKIRIILENEIKEKSAVIFRKYADDFNSKINRIYKLTSEIFDMEFKQIYVDYEYSVPSVFDYITYEFKLMFDFDKSRFAVFLPKKLHNKIITEKYVKRIDFTVNYNCGYVIDGIKRRLEKALLGNNAVMREKVVDTIEKIKNVIEKVKDVKENYMAKFDNAVAVLKKKTDALSLIKSNLK